MSELLYTQEQLIQVRNDNYNAGVETERKRIIKLLERYFKPEEAKAIYPANYEQYLDIVALIKGVKK